MTPRFCVSAVMTIVGEFFPADYGDGRR